jgi:hypothetical protein
MALRIDKGIGKLVIGERDSMERDTTATNRDNVMSF